MTAKTAGTHAGTRRRPPKLAVWKFASCDGCQLSLLNLEDELLALAGEVDIAYFTEASAATKPGPYDLSLVEGSITTPDDAERIRRVRGLIAALDAGIMRAEKLPEIGLVVRVRQLRLDS